MIKRISGAARWLRLGCVVFVVGCGGASQPAENPEPPPLDDEPAESSGAAEPSSAKVKEGMDAIAAGDFETARTVLQEASNDNPDDAQAAFYLGVAEESLGNTEAAIAAYDKATTLDPKLVEGRINLSGVLLDAEQPERALTVADEGLKLEPKSGPLLLNRAVALDALERSPEALEAYAAAAKSAPKSARTHLLYAEALARGGDEKRALEEAKLGKDSDELDVLASTGRLLGRLKSFDECVQVLTRALGIEKAAELYVHRGICRHGQKDDAGAKADFEASVAADESYAPGYFYLGQHLKAAGDKAGAKKAFQKVVELDPQGGVAAAAKKALKGL